ncbi:GLPGLI family protein [Pedobacter montanisoli]|uniref:GLPGLI family protein n=1 Tax=Pedobacter montanisoli TaxID=2923277 RepID=A0ABS9ZU44_9SPHI|nr:GLPGLI family protein [Pedobacter montanisoli]MCJ0742131.1 GLPGLI family protein [Pedobacter montanisoli]
MNKIKNFIIIILLVAMHKSYAQHTRFVTQGTIEFEKRINSFALIKKQMELWGNSDNIFSKTFVENYQKNNPQFKLQKSKLTFANNKTLFTPIEDAVASNGFLDLIQFQQNNTILTKVNEGTSTILKKVYEQNYLINDSTRKINWKITDEFRDIAGYNCRRANALIMDSVYVVAFYTDEIAVSGGPEGFSGLPGMILGVALPYEHVTWFATSVNDQPITDDKLKAPTKGKAVNHKQLYDILKEAFKSWGKTANENYKWFTL